MSKDTIYFETDGFERFRSFLVSECTDNQVFLLVDENTKRDCLPVIQSVLETISLNGVLEIPAGENHKSFDTLQHILSFLTENDARRDAVLINLGGGVITDIGGFAAAIYKRGIRYVNLPTSLLAQIDASFGGKTGIDFAGFKNQIGAFCAPEATFIATSFLKTLPSRELKSGWAEAFKHALIADANYWKQLQNTDSVSYADLVSTSIAIKSEIVKADPFEKNIRKKLNFGHTIGHAVESYFLEEKKQHLLHGEAVAVGIICESYLSWKQNTLSEESFYAIVFTLSHFYTKFDIQINDITPIVKRMYHDKKNTNSQISFTLLDTIGAASIQHYCDEAFIIESLEFYIQLQ